MPKLYFEDDVKPLVEACKEQFLFIKDDDEVGKKLLRGMLIAHWEEVLANFTAATTVSNTGVGMEKQISDESDLVPGWYWCRIKSEDVYESVEWMLLQWDEGGAFWIPGVEKTAYVLDDLSDCVLAFRYDVLKSYEIPTYELALLPTQRRITVEELWSVFEKAINDGKKDYLTLHRLPVGTDYSVHLSGLGIKAIAAFINGKEGV